MNDDIFPLKVYGSSISYFTGKLEMFLRAKGMAYEFFPMKGKYGMRNIGKLTGAVQMPAATLSDGRWMTDTTPIIDWLETQQPFPPIVPQDQEQRFFSLLLEDYADEWLWRPAMHYRWYADRGATFASRHLAEELMSGLPLPGGLKRLFLRRRQRSGFTTGDGVNEKNRTQVEAIYHNNMDWLTAVLQQRPFLLGNSPSLVDVAFMGPFFRHFAQDPVPAQIMRQQAPLVWEWIARMWSVGPEYVTGDWVAGVPEDWNPWLDDIGQHYLPYLNANVAAAAAGKKRAPISAGGVDYPNARISAYRVWCLEQLRTHFKALVPDTAQRVQRRLERHGCWEPLWQVENLNSGVNEGRDIPFGTNATML